MEKVKKSRVGRIARMFGIKWEREFINKLKAIGFENVVSCRAESRIKDARGIDVCGEVYPLAIQCKATSNSVPCIKKTFDHLQCPDTEYKIIALKIRNKGNYVIMQDDDWLEFVAMLKANEIL